MSPTQTQWVSYEMRPEDRGEMEWKIEQFVKCRRKLTDQEATQHLTEIINEAVEAVKIFQGEWPMPRYTVRPAPKGNGWYVHGIRTRIAFFRTLPEALACCNALNGG
jgi:hypothetical protein